jgi:hypothetical protein
MSKRKNHWRALAAVGVTAALIAGCDNGATTHTEPVPTSPPSATLDFTVFATQAFSNNANSTPVALNNISFNFDSNDDPTAFDSLIAAGSF